MMTLSPSSWPTSRRPCFDGLDGAAGGHQVAPRQEVIVFIDDDDVGADGADVHADIGLDRPVRRSRHGVRDDRIVVPDQRGQRDELVLAPGDIVPQALEGIRRQRAAAGGQGGPHRPQHGEVLRDDQVGLGELEDLEDGAADAFVGGHPALEGHRPFEVAPADDLALEVAYHGEAEAGDDVVDGGAHLLEVDHVALGEDGAAAGDAGRVLGLQGDVAELLDGDAHARGLLVEEGAGAGGADAVEGEVGHPGRRLGGVLFQDDELGVLAADLEDGADLGMEAGGAGGLGGDLIDEGDAQQRGDELAAGAGGRGCLELAGRVVRQ